MIGDGVVVVAAGIGAEVVLVEASFTEVKGNEVAASFKSESVANPPSERDCDVATVEMLPELAIEVADAVSGFELDPGFNYQVDL